MPKTSLLGQTIMGYQVVEELGSGSFGTVYKVVKDSKLLHDVRALKHIPVFSSERYQSVLKSMGGDAQKADAYFAGQMETVAEEVRTLNALSKRDSQHVVRYYESDLIESDSPRRYDVYLLMEYLTPFGRFEDLPDSFTVQDVVRFGLEVLDGIGFCHQHGVIHRDIKEDNIFVTDEGTYKIGDFGIAKNVSDGSDAMSIKGTPSSIAPEVYLRDDSSSYTKSIDLYSLGMVLYRLLNYGRNPFMPAYPASYSISDERNAFTRRLKGDLPPAPALGGPLIGQVIVQSLKSAGQRFQNAEAFIAALQSAAGKTSPSVLSARIHDVAASGREEHPQSAESSMIRPEYPSEKTPDEAVNDSWSFSGSGHVSDDAETIVEVRDGGVRDGVVESHGETSGTTTEEVPRESGTETGGGTRGSSGRKQSKVRGVLTTLLAFVLVAAAAGGATWWYLNRGTVSSEDVPGETSEPVDDSGSDSPEPDTEPDSQDFPNPYQGKYGTWTDGVYVSGVLGIRIEPKGIIQPYYGATDSDGEHDFVYAYNYGTEGWGVATILEAPELDGIDPAHLESTVDGTDLEPITLGDSVWYRNGYESERGFETELYQSVGGKMVVIHIIDPVYGAFAKLFINQISPA